MESFFVRARDRRTVRRQTRMPCEVVRERDFKLVARTMLDLSPEGMRVEAESNVLTGENLIVSFRMPGAYAPSGSRGSLWIDTEATVARVIHGRRYEDRERSLGVRFSPLKTLTRHALADALRAMPRQMAN